MMFRFPCFVLCLFLFATKVTFGQLTLAPGYLIQPSGDSLSGQLEYVNSNFPGKRAFIPAATGKLIFLKPSEIKEIYIEPEIHFKTVALKGKKVLMKVITEGQLNLYAYKRDLFLRNPADSLILLTGGRKTVEENGKKTAIVDYTYKSQLRKLLPDNTYNARLERLSFEQMKINQFARIVNGSQGMISARPQLKNQHQFEVRAGFTVNYVMLKNIPYAQDSLNSNESLFQALSNAPLPAEKQTLHSMMFGVFYKKKIGTRYSYLKGGLVFNNGFKTRRTQHRHLYRGFTISSSGDYPSDTVGRSADTYTYKFNSLDIPLSYYAELTDGRFRPFIDLGLTTRLYNMASVTLKREIYNEVQLLRTETGKMKFPGFIVAPMLGLGCKYVLSENNALLAGVQADRYFGEYGKRNDNLVKSTSLNFYIAYGF